MDADRKYWLGFNMVKGIGPAKLRALVDYFGDIAGAWQANERDLLTLGVDARTIRSFLDSRAQLDLDAELAKVEAAGIALLTWDAPAYPPALKNIPNPPPLLYMQGALLETDRWAVAIVGTRRLTSYGRQMTRELVSGLVNHGIAIVSGLARGIDSIAHKTAVELGGRTIGVLGSGLDAIYPPENRVLAASMIDGHGALLSEYALGVQPEAKNFPPRNRVISALALGTVVVEAGERSGALITADFAREQGREVFALPGNVTSRASHGTNRLIQQGARLVMSVDDILEELNLGQAPEQKAVQLALPDSAEEAALMGALANATPRHIDELSRSTGMPAALVSSTLTLMELKGAVQQVGGMQYILVREAGIRYNSNADDGGNSDDDESAAPFD